MIDEFDPMQYAAKLDHSGAQTVFIQKGKCFLVDTAPATWTAEIIDTPPPWMNLLGGSIIKAMAGEKHEASERTSIIVNIELENLALEYKELVIAELKDMNNGLLVQLSMNRASNWSGGHSICNYAEQVVREAALEQLRDNMADELYGNAEEKP